MSNTVFAAEPLSRLGKGLFLAQQPVEKAAAMLMASKKPRKAEEQLADSASFKIAILVVWNLKYSFSTGC